MSFNGYTKVYIYSCACMLSCYTHFLCWLAPVMQYMTILTRCGSAWCSLAAWHTSDSAWWLWSTGRPTREAVRRQARSHLADPIPVSNLKSRAATQPTVGCDTKSHRSIYHKRKLLMMMFFFKCTNIKSGEVSACVYVCAWQKCLLALHFCCGKM